MSNDIIYKTDDFHVVAIPDEDSANPWTGGLPGFEFDLQVNNYISLQSNNFRASSSPDYWEFPIYGYAHSGVVLSLTPFNCRWDSGQAGVVRVLRPSRGGEWRRRKTFLVYLTACIEELNNYLSGNCWGYQVIDSSTEEVIDSCWGFIGDHEKSGLYDAAAESANHYQSNQPE